MRNSGRFAVEKNSQDKKELRLGANKPVTVLSYRTNREVLILCC